MQDKMLKHLECDRPWRTIFGSLISLTDQKSCIWSRMHFLLCGRDRGKKWDLWCWLRWRPHCEVRMPRAQGGREWSCSTESHSSSLWERDTQEQPGAEVGAGREGVRAAGTQNPCWGGGDTHGATGDPTLAVDTQQENELFAKWKKRGWKIITWKF